MKTKTLLLSLMIATIFGCREQCEIDNTGTYLFLNNTDDPIRIESDGIYLTQLSAWGNITEKFDVGTYSIRVTQVSGYILYPTIWENTIFVTACSERSLTYQ